MAIEDEARWGWRIPVVLLLVILVVLATTVAVVTGWSRATLVDTDGYVDALVAPLAADAEVKDAIATELAHQMTKETGAGFAANFQQWLPPGATAARAALGQWGAQIEQAWRERLGPAIRTQLDQPTFTALWTQANAEGHRQLIDALTKPGTGATVTIDMNAIVQQAVREVGVQIDSQLGLPNVGTTFYGAIADALPPEIGRISVDVSRIGKPARTAISLVDPIFALSLGAAVFFALLAVGAAPPRRRGTAVLVLGVACLLTAGALWSSVNSQARTAGDRAAAMAVQPFSPEMHLIVDRQAALAAQSFRGWLTATAAVGLGLVLIGGLWRIGSGRAARSDPFVDAAYTPVQEWNDAPVSPWSNRGY
jgi:hypothetical protein